MAHHNRLSRVGSMGRRGLICALAILAPIFGGVQEAMGRGRYDRLFVVPPPTTVTIDGNLDDWDLSGQIQLYVVPETVASQSAKFAVMYDDQALYLAGVVRDTSPMMNRHDPNASGDRGWDADASQFRIVLDSTQPYPETESVAKYKNLRDPDGKPLSPAQQQAADQRDDIAHLTLWYYTDKAQPVLQLHQGLTYRVPRADWAPFGIVPDDLFEAKYVKAADGLSYTFEYRIPWSTLGAAKPPTGDDIVAGTVQFNWSRPDGLKTAGGAAWAYEVLNRPGFPFQTANVWGKLIFRDQGGVPRSLVDAGLPPEKPLPFTFEYDVPEDSELTVQLINDENLIVRTLVAQGKRNAGKTIERWDGLDDQGQPLPAGRYRWRGIYHDPIQAKWRFSVHNSGMPPYPTPDNTGGWGGDHGIPTDVVAIPGGMLLSWSGAEYGWGIIRVDSQGKKLWGSKQVATHLATDGQRFFTIGQEGFQVASGVKVFDLKDSRPLSFAGKSEAGLEPTGDKHTDHMTGLAYDDGKLYIAYQHRNQIGVFDAHTAQLLDTIPVSQPTDLASGPNGTILAISGTKVVAIRNQTVTPFATTPLDHPQALAVSDEGTVYVSNRGQLMNVSVFDATGQSLGSIGKPGGRNAIGTYQPEGMFQPAGMAISPAGHLWVAEAADSPKRISTWDLQTGRNLREFFGGSSYAGYCFIDAARPTEIYAHNVLWQINWQTYTTTPVSTIWRQTSPNTMLSILPDGYQGVLKVFTRPDGNQFAYGGADNATILSMRKGDIFQPIAASFQIRRGQYGYAAEQFELIKDQTQYPNGDYFWQDNNDDGTVQPQEIQRFTLKWHKPHFKAVDPQTMTAWITTGFQLKPHTFTSQGRPLYRIDDVEPNFLADHPSRAGNGYIWLDPDGTVYTLIHRQRPSWARWSPEGKLLAGYPNLRHWYQSLGLPLIKAGRLHGMTGPLGIAGDFTGNMTYFGVTHLFQRDGTYVAAIGYDGRVDGDPSLQGQPEGQGGVLAKLTLDGNDRYFLLHGGQDCRVIELFGLDTIKPLTGGTYEISKSDAAQAAQANTDYKATLAKRGGLAIARNPSSLSLSKPVGKQLEQNRGFEATLAYDRENLYARYVVTADHPLVNAQADPRILFKGGNLIDLQLATNPTADPDRTQPAAGDLRLLISRDPAGQTKAILYQPRLPNSPGNPIVLKSPTGEESFDAIREVSDQITLDYTPQSTGFEAIVTIPLKLLGFTPQPSQILKADVGYIFGNGTGTKALVRAYWSNNSFTANVVDDIPHESRLQPLEWGQALIE